MVFDLLLKFIHITGQYDQKRLCCKFIFFYILVFLPLNSFRKQKSATPDSHTARVQMRRLDRLKEILDSLKKKPEAPTFKPMEMLNCSYLRLSKSNVEELEDMVRKAGMDPGIHVHSDLSGYDLFADLKREAEAGKRLHTEDGPSRLTPTPSPTPSRRHSVKSGSSVHH